MRSSVFTNSSFLKIRIHKGFPIGQASRCRQRCGKKTRATHHEDECSLLSDHLHCSLLPPSLSERSGCSFINRPKLIDPSLLLSSRESIRSSASAGPDRDEIEAKTMKRTSRARL